KDYEKILAEYRGARVVLGIRPEHIYLADHVVDPGENLYPVESKVDLVESLGSDTILHVDVNGNTLVVKTSGAYKFEIGQHVKLYIDLGKIHVFRESGEAIF
ncbi:MAG TPA: TOBE domain-containing protein, partial [Pyrodictium sp.]|nr:TOBE domain-containing protein [Pyrodictium sp.]